MIPRLARSSLDLLTNMRALATAGVTFVAISQGLEVKPHGDAIAALLMTVLAAVVEFERELIVERTRLGVEKARSKGVRFGRAPVVDDHGEARAVELRRQGLAWPAVAQELDCTVSAARRAHARGCRKGTPETAVATPLND